MEFLNPSRLGWLALVAVLAMAYLLVSVKSGRKSRESFGGAVPRQSGLKRHLSVIACLLSVATLVIAWAQPLGVHQVPRQRATVVVAIDVSHSMRAQQNRICEELGKRIRRSAAARVQRFSSPFCRRY